jgi:hypothetical protein
MNKTILLAAFALSLSLPVKAANYVTIETDSNYQLFSASFTNVTAGTFDPSGLGAGVVAKGAKNIIGFSWAMYAAGANGNFTIAHATRTFSSSAVNPSGFNNPSPFNLSGTAPIISTSPLTTVINGIPLNGTFQSGPVINPFFTFSGLSASATYFIYLEAGINKAWQ